MPTPAISRALLASFEGLHISAICAAVRFVKDADNHCAHFVNHVLGFDAPLTCAQMTGRSGPSANIRVHETFAACPVVGDFAQRPTDEPCLAFTTQRSAVDLNARTMSNVPKKHIGIFCDGEIWHYSNSGRKVVRQTPAAFSQHFAGNEFGLFFGAFPAGTRVLVPAAVGSAAAPVLRRGQSDSADVAVWQQFLILRGLLFGRPIQQLLDGGFGPRTEEATEAFQTSVGLPADGIVEASTNDAAVGLGFVPRTAARQRVALAQAQVTAALTVAAVDALHRLGPHNVFYTEEVLNIDGQHVVARLEPHKHTSGAQLRFWHRGITLYV